MQRALALARETVGLASPNPQVGCVLVRDGVVLGEGAHRYDAFDHAEIVALKAARAAGHSVAGATAYVTLEPCSHHGRTGPCADALIAAQVARVVAATADPNPQVAGRGLARLRAAGVAVATGTCEAEARALNNGFAKWVQTGRPFVTLKAAVSADGMISPPDSTRTKTAPHWITGPQARALVQPMRHAADAILTGIGTVLADDPQLTDRSGLPRRRPLLRVVLDSQLRTPPTAKLVRSAATDLLIVCSAAAPADREHALRNAGAEVIRLPGGAARLNLGAVLDIVGKRGILSLLLECGSALNTAFLHAGLADAVTIFQSQRTMGTGSIPFAAGIDLPSLQASLRYLLRGLAGEDTVTRGLLHDPWAGGLG